MAEKDWKGASSELAHLARLLACSPVGISSNLLAWSRCTAIK
jgi:hypothetical protein